MTKVAEKDSVLWLPMTQGTGTTGVPSAVHGMIFLGHASVAFVVYGACWSMKNGKTAWRTVNPKAKKFEEDFALQVPPEAKRSLGSKTQFLRGIVSVFYPSWLQDVDVEIVWDLLQKCGVVSNDRWIREKHIYGCAIDKERPRVEIILEEI